MIARVLLVTFLSSTVLTLLLAAKWARDLQDPQVILLEAGNAISALVVSGDARVLIVSGNDPIALGNALASVRRLTTHRVDVLVNTSPGGLNFDLPARRTISLGNPPILHGLYGRNQPATSLPNPLTLELTGDIQIRIEVATRINAVEAQPIAWRATIRSPRATIVIISRATDAALFPSFGSVAAVVVSAGAPAIADLAIDSGLIVVKATSGPGEGRRLREEVAATARNPTWVDRLFPDQALRLRLNDGGLLIPASAQIAQTEPGATLPRRDHGRLAPL